MCIAAMPLAVVTGANRGLGLAAAQLLAGEGYSVLAVARRAADARCAAERLPGGVGRHAAAELDVRALAKDSDAAEAVVEVARRASADAGGVALLVNNAGVYLDSWDAAAFEESFEVNVIGPVRLAQALMQADAFEKENEACVLNVSSGYGKLSEVSEGYRRRLGACETVDEVLSLPFDASDAAMATAFVAPYKVSKAALNRATRLMAEQWEPRGVRVAAVCPGWCRTRMGGAEATRSAEQGARSILAGRGAALGGDGFSRDGKPVVW